MDPERRKALEKIVRRERLRLLIVPALVFAGIAGVAGWVLLPRETLDPVQAILERFETQPSDGEVQTRMVLTLPDGGVIRARPYPGDSALSPGATVCLHVSRHRVTQALRYARIPDTRCADQTSKAAAKQ